METPAPAEYRALPAVGILGVLQLVQTAVTFPDLKLWVSAPFLATMVVLIAVTGYGIVGFFKHWKTRAIAPAVIVIVYGLVAFGQPTLWVLVALALAFVAVAYFVSPDRAVVEPAPIAPRHPNDAEREHVIQTQLAQIEQLVRERDASLLENAGLRGRLAALETPRESGPLLRGTIERFESLERTSYVSDSCADDLRREYGREPRAEEFLRAALRRPSGPEYIAWVKMETVGTPSKATDWSVTVNHKDGDETPCKLMAFDWGPPKTWPQNVKFHSTAEMQSMVLQNSTLYNVILHVTCEASQDQLNMRSFQLKVLDDNGAAVVCSMQKPGGAI